MAGKLLLQDLGGELGQHLAFRTDLLQEALLQAVGHDDNVAAVQRERHVVELRVQRDSEVRGKGPGGGGPDHHGGLFAGKRGHRAPQVLLQGELDEHRGGLVVGVLDLGLGERRAAGRAPVYRLLALVEAAVLCEARQFTGGGPFVARVHGQVGLVPVAEDPEALELLALDADELGGVLAAELSHLELRDLVLLGAQVLLDLQLDGEAVAVPPRHVRGGEAFHPLALEDDVLQDLVQRVADMDVTVGVRRTVVQDVTRAVRPRLVDLLVYVNLVPALEHLGLALGQIALHRKVGTGEIESILVIHVNGLQAV